MYKLKPLNAFWFFALASLLFWLAQTGYESYSRKPESPVVLFASFESGVNGSWLELRADHTFAYTTAFILGEDEVTSGYYQLHDSLLILDQLPPRGLLQSRRLLIRYTRPLSPSSTGESVWQIAPSGRVDSSLAVLSVYPVQPPK